MKKLNKVAMLVKVLIWLAAPKLVWKVAAMSIRRRFGRTSNVAVAKYAMANDKRNSVPRDSFSTADASSLMVYNSWSQLAYIIFAEFP